MFEHKHNLMARPSPEQMPISPEGTAVFSNNMRRALRFAIRTHEVHQKQKRKGKDIPYITHPLVVGMLLARTGASEEVVIAGMLHDTVEDSSPDHKVDVSTLEKEFGAKVAALVDSVTEHNKSLPWEERKREALLHIDTLDHDGLLLKSADIISNMRELIDDYADDGDAVFARFKRPKEALISNFRSAIEMLLRRWPESPLTRDLQELQADMEGAFVKK
jgi:(p)ppGpp synthase/HD superfamily hydrolase